MKQFFLSAILLFALLQVVLAIQLTAAQLKTMSPAANECLLWFGKPPATYADMNDFLDRGFIPRNGGTSVQKLLIKAAIPIPKGVHPTFWNEVSRIFAAQASGQVRILIGPLTRPYKDTVFYNDELPELTKAGSKVTEIVTIDAANPTVQKVIWKKGGKNWGKGGTDEASTPKGIFDVPKSGSCTILRRRGANDSCSMPAGRGKTAPPKTAAKTTAKTGGGAGAGTPGASGGRVTKPAGTTGKTGTGPSAKVKKPAKTSRRKVRRSGPSRLAVSRR